MPTQCQGMCARHGLSRVSALEVMYHLDEHNKHAF